MVLVVVFDDQYTGTLLTVAVAIVGFVDEAWIVVVCDELMEVGEEQVEEFEDIKSGYKINFRFNKVRVGVWV